MTDVLENEEDLSVEQSASSWARTAALLKDGANNEFLNSLTKTLPQPRTYATKLATRDEVATLKIMVEDLEARVYILEANADYLLERDARRSSRFWSFVKSLTIVAMAYATVTFVWGIAHQVGFL